MTTTLCIEEWIKLSDRIAQLESENARLKALLADVWNKYSGVQTKPCKLDSELESRVKEEGITI